MSRSFFASARARSLRTTVNVKALDGSTVQLTVRPASYNAEGFASAAEQMRPAKGEIAVKAPKATTAEGFEFQQAEYVTPSSLAAIFRGETVAAPQETAKPQETAAKPQETTDNGNGTRRRQGASA